MQRLSPVVDALTRVERRCMVRFARCLFAALFVVSSISPHAAAAASKGTVRIGLLEPASGPLAPEGSDVDGGFRYFLVTHGDRLGGFDVELRTGDEGTSVDAAVAVAHQLVEQDAVDVIVGIVSSSDAYGIAPYVDEQKKLLVVTGAGADDLTQETARRTIFRVAHTSSQDVMPLGDYACHRMHARDAVLVASDQPYDVQSAGGFARAYTIAGCRVMQELYVPVPTSDWNAVIAKIDKHAHVVYASVGVTDAPAFLGAYRAAGERAALVADGTLTDERLLSQERERAIGVTSGLHYTATLATAENTAFRRGYETLTSRRVSQHVENGYVAAELLSAALDRQPPGPLKNEQLLAALRAASLTAPRGPVHFDRYQQIVDNVYIRRVRQVGGLFRNEVVATFPAVSQFWQYDAVAYLQLPTFTKLKGTWARP